MSRYSATSWCALRSRSAGTARLVATDASVGGDTTGIAWIGENGTWWAAGARTGWGEGRGYELRAEFIDEAEALALAAAVQAHPSRLLVLTDSAACCGMFWNWIRRGPQLRPEWDHPELRGLLEAVRTRWETPNEVRVRWVRRRSLPIHRGADTLTRIARLYCIPDSEEKRISAQGLLKRCLPPRSMPTAVHFTEATNTLMAQTLAGVGS